MVKRNDELRTSLIGLSRYVFIPMSMSGETNGVDLMSRDGEKQPDHVIAVGAGLAMIVWHRPHSAENSGREPAPVFRIWRKAVRIVEAAFRSGERSQGLVSRSSELPFDSSPARQLDP